MKFHGCSLFVVVEPSNFDAYIDQSDHTLPNGSYDLEDDFE